MIYPHGYGGNTGRQYRQSDLMRLKNAAKFAGWLGKFRNSSIITVILNFPLLKLVFRMFYLRSGTQL